LSGLLYVSILIGLGSSFFASSIYISSLNLINDFEYLSIFIKNLPLIGSFFGGFFAFFINSFLYYHYDQEVNTKLYGWYNSLFFSSFLLYYMKIKLFVSQQ
jgi:hypothetical protein